MRTRVCNQIGEEIYSVDDWLVKAPPKRGALQWKDYRSAKELAKAWFRSQLSSPPQELMEYLESSFRPQSVVLTEATAEVVIKLDNYRGEQRNADLVILGSVGPKRLLVSIEAKADEAFGDQLLGEYFDARNTVSRSMVPTRIRHLVRALFDSDLDEEIREFRYQLIHSAAATLIEAQNRKAEIAVFLVHEFLSPRLSPEKVRRNQCDWNSFLARLARGQAIPTESEQMVGPIFAPGGGFVPSSVPLYLGKVRTMLA